MRIFILVLIVQFFSCQNKSKEIWIELDSLNYARGEHASAVVNGEIYAFVGLFDHFKGPNQIEKYNPQKDEWVVVDEWNQPKHHVTAGASVWGDEVWLCGGKWGKDSNVFSRVDVYNTKTNTWREGPELPEVHWAGPSVIIGSKLHVLTGAIDRNNSTDHHFVLDLNNESKGWENASPVPEPRVHSAAVALNGNIYLIGGEYHHAHDGDTPILQVYDPDSDTWDLTKAPMPLSRSHHEWSTFAYKGKILSVSGVDSANGKERGQSAILIYDPEADNWMIRDQLPFDMCSAGAKAIGNKLYVFGGGYDDWIPVHGKTFVTSINLDED